MSATILFRASCRIAIVWLLTLATSALAQDKESNEKIGPGSPGPGGIQRGEVRPVVPSSPEPRRVPSKEDRQQERDFRNSQSLFGAGYEAPQIPAGSPLEMLQRRMQELEKQRQQLAREYQAAVEAQGNRPGGGPGQAPGMPIPPAAPAAAPGGWNPQAAGLLPTAPIAPEFDVEKQELRRQLQMKDAQLLEFAANQERMKFAPPLPDDATLRAFPLKYVRPQDIAQALHNITGGGGLRIAIDDRTNALLLAGNEKQMSVAQQLIEALDRPGKETQSKPAETVQVRVVWMLDGLDDRGPEPPKASIVSPQVIDALGELGFKNPQVVCQQLTTLTLGQQDRRGQFHFQVPVLIEGSPWQFQGQGAISPMPDDRYAMEFNLNVQQTNNPQTAQLSGSILTPLNHYTVLGTTTFVGSGAPGEVGGPPQSEHLSAFIVYLDRAKEFSGAESKPKVKAEKVPR